MGKENYLGAGKLQELESRHPAVYTSNAAGDSKGKGFDAAVLTQITSANPVRIEDVNAVRTDEPPKRLTRRKRIRRHYRRWWKVHVVGLIILLAIGLPILFLVIIPAIAQKMVNDADLPIHEVAIMNPTLNTTEVSLVTSLKVPKGFSVRLEPLVLQLYNPAESEFIPFVEIAIAEQKLEGDTRIEIKNQTVAISNRDQFVKFLRNAVLNETFVMAARGKTRAHIGKLHADVKLDKEVRLNGLNSLKGYAINSASVKLPPAEDGTNLLASLTLPNPSVVSFDLGNETLNILGPNKLIMGNALLQNVFIRPGNNTFDAVGTMDLKRIVQNLPALIQYEAQSLARGNLKLGASGNSTVFNGVHVDYYEEILNELYLEGEVPVISLLAGSLGELLNGGLPGLQNLTSSLGLNVSQILETLTRNDDIAGTGLGMADLTQIMTALGEAM